MRPKESQGWAVFAPSGALSWRSVDATREGAIRKYMLLRDDVTEEQFASMWGTQMEAGCRCLRVRVAFAGA